MCVCVCVCVCVYEREREREREREGGEEIYRYIDNQVNSEVVYNLNLIFKCCYLVVIYLSVTTH